MFPSSKDNYIALSRMPNDEDRRSLYSQLREYGRFTGLCWITSPEPPPTKPLHIPTIEEIIYCEEFLTIDGQDSQIAFLQDKVKVTEICIKEIAGLTKGQRDNPLWHQAQRGRLTASNFGCVLKAKRTTPSLITSNFGCVLKAKRTTPSLIKRYLGEYDL
jgi:hypothetical protein